MVTRRSSPMWSAQSGGRLLCIGVIQSSSWRLIRLPLLYCFPVQFAALCSSASTEMLFLFGNALYKVSRTNRSDGNILQLQDLYKNFIQVFKVALPNTTIWLFSVRYNRRKTPVIKCYYYTEQASCLYCTELRIYASQRDQNRDNQHCSF